MRRLVLALIIATLILGYMQISLAAPQPVCSQMESVDIAGLKGLKSLSIFTYVKTSLREGSMIDASAITNEVTDAVYDVLRKSLPPEISVDKENPDADGIIYMWIKVFQGGLETIGAVGLECSRNVSVPMLSGYIPAIVYNGTVYVFGFGLLSEGGIPKTILDISKNLSTKFALDFIRAQY